MITNREKRQENHNARNDILESLGLEILGNSLAEIYGVEIDVSAIEVDLKTIVGEIVRQVHKAGRKEGKEEIRQAFKKLMMPEED